MRILTMLALAAALLVPTASPARADSGVVTGVAQFNDGIPAPGFAPWGHALLEVNVSPAGGVFVVRHNWFSGFDWQLIVGVADEVTVTTLPDGTVSADIQADCVGISAAPNTYRGPCALRVDDGGAGPAVLAAGLPGVDFAALSMAALQIGLWSSEPVPNKGQVENGALTVAPA